MAYRILVFLFFVSISSAFATEQLYVSSTQDLYKAIKLAHSKPELNRIILEPGVYQLTHRIVLKRDGLTLTGRKGALSTILKGKGMKKNQTPEVLIDVMASYITISGVTLKNSGNHLIQVRAEHDADFFHLSNCILQDSYEQLLKVSASKAIGHYSDDGKIENCVFEYTAGIGPQFYIGGIDAHRANNWLVKNNKFENIASPSGGVAEHAIHFWNNSSNNYVVDNIILNSDRGIGFGLGKSQNQGGVIKGNYIIHTVKNHPYADAGIILESSPDTVIKNNTILLYHDYPNAIEYRFPSTTNISIIQNKTNRKIKKRDGASAYISRNVTLK
ncbi:right-handed parallel beta-helix repeat-containing protein [Alteromonas sp. 1_MG-2023]|uniref:right-handed parallel beta-helix repeat-containing protein n=1 Tax=Alteromonas sp. 1_MG-2023 TaxID=3062669 RepID=UPI0026E1D578|nr:right-handed parallel beta-helix repeat-containing protein [Alteromonas sp. 1_MG-2023]MDO6566334.1 right-handed parallel beta-helix repeat-containing protein [Alteromonas sp. 1_MG-2023]